MLQMVACGRRRAALQSGFRWAFANFVLVGYLVLNLVSPVHMMLAFSGVLENSSAIATILARLHMQVAYVKANNLTFNAGFVATDAAAANSIAFGDVFPLGTGALSYISAAAYQLRDAGILDTEQPVTTYLDPADFGFYSQWCPGVYGQPVATVAGTPPGQPSSGGMTTKISHHCLLSSSERSACIAIMLCMATRHDAVFV